MAAKPSIEEKNTEKSDLTFKNVISKCVQQILNTKHLHYLVVQGP